MNLNNDNYFSIEADKEYMSVSQFKNFKNCEAKAIHDLNVDSQESKQAFLEGHLFENIVTGNKDLFIASHPELISSRGPTAGQIKSDYKKVIDAAERFSNQEFFNNIIKKCEKQVILTGIINGVKVKCCLDLFDKKTNSIYDIKCMKDFKKQWLENEKTYVPWYYAYDYVLQLAVYREIVRQNFGEPKEIGLIAATKENVTDLEALSFSPELLDLELEQFKTNIKRYDLLKKEALKPTNCGICDYCKSIKTITSFEEVK